MKRILPILLSICILLSGCTNVATQPDKQYTATFLTLFDTVTTIIGRAESEESFKGISQKIHDELLVYHRLFDIYNSYDGINNLKTVNDSAGISPVLVDGEIISFLNDCRRYYSLTDGKVNAAMGSVLSLWHDARNNGFCDPQNAYLPEFAALQEASAHTSFDSLIVDEIASTVFITDPHMQLDVGAIGKGWAVQKVAQQAPEGLLISVGGNVYATGPKEKDVPWVIGIQDPHQSDRNLHTIYLNSGAVVTSGDYQRMYSVNGKTYHHIIDPQTLMPSEYWRSVTIVCPDSALADALSTALFLMPLDEGTKLLDACGAEAFWVDLDGNEYFSKGFKSMLRT